MRTVGEFKANGGVIVNGDQVIGCDGFVGKVMCCKTFNETIQYDEDVVVELAWRTNTGVKPELGGKVELMDGKRNTGVKHSSEVSWERLPQAGDANIIKWRPHLPAAIQTETPEEKEAFEAMNKSPYDVGAHVSDASKPVYTPEAGSYCEIYLDGHWQECFIAGSSKDGNPVIQMGLHCVESVGCEFKPIKTEHEKAIDEMVATAANSADDIARSIIYDACVKLANAGYVKPCGNNK